eukprot:TRINITY_DN16043_c0_g5_i1.p1 TRINITY_DN16043_c0_g5~~TRINITY_DN16043_c0_g5_i1.p1  ORF type:complete len:970 (+),score=196.21 TRINITY_DN16043_c0_g5_i1:67-2976(+)
MAPGEDGDAPAAEATQTGSGGSGSPQAQRARRVTTTSLESARTVVLHDPRGRASHEGGPARFLAGDPFATELPSMAGTSVSTQSQLPLNATPARARLQKRLSTLFLLQGRRETCDDIGQAQWEANVEKIRALLHADKGTGHRLFLPEDPWRWVWDCLVLLTAMYYGATVPAAIMWPEALLHIHTFVIECIMSVVLLADIYINMHTIVMHDGILQDRRPLIWKVYLRRWALVDAVAALPIDVVLFFVLGPGQCCYARIPRALKLLKVERLFSETIPESITEAHVWWIYRCVPIIKGLLWTWLVLHWLSMFRIFLVWDEPPETGRRNYVTAVYWVTCTLTTVGYGDIHVTSDGQRLYAIVLSVLGTVMNGLVIGSLIRLLTQSDVGTERNDRMRETLATLQYFDVPKILKQEALAYRRYQLQNMINSDLPGVLDGFPAQLADDIAVYVKLKFINLVSMFEHASDDCKIEMAKALDIRVAQMQTVICEAHEPVDELCLIAHGFVEMVTQVDQGGEYSTVLRRGDFFGEVALLLGKASCTVHAMTYCELYTLSKLVFLSVLEDYPDFALIIRQKLRNMEATIGRNLDAPPQDPPPNAADLEFGMDFSALEATEAEPDEPQQGGADDADPSAEGPSVSGDDNFNIGAQATQAGSAQASAQASVTAPGPPTAVSPLAGRVGGWRGRRLQTGGSEMASPISRAGVAPDARLNSMGSGHTLSPLSQALTVADGTFGEHRNSNGSMASNAAALWDVRRASEALSKIEARHTSPRAAHHQRNRSVHTPVTLRGQAAFAPGLASAPTSPRERRSSMRGLSAGTATPNLLGQVRRPPRRLSTDVIAAGRMQGAAALGLAPDGASEPNRPFEHGGVEATVEALSRRMDRLQESVAALVTEGFAAQHAAIEALAQQLHAAPPPKAPPSPSPVAAGGKPAGNPLVPRQHPQHSSHDNQPAMLPHEPAPASRPACDRPPPGVAPD